VAAQASANSTGFALSVSTRTKAEPSAPRSSIASARYSAALSIYRTSQNTSGACEANAATSGIVCVQDRNRIAPVSAFNQLALGQRNFLDRSKKFQVRRRDARGPRQHPAWRSRQAPSARTAATCPFEQRGIVLVFQSKQRERQPIGVVEICLPISRYRSFAPSNAARISLLWSCPRLPVTPGNFLAPGITHACASGVMREVCRPRRDRNPRKGIREAPCAR